eukprot:scaffold33040_cov73-Isochrysis_galbana.AAC.1
MAPCSTSTRTSSILRPTRLPRAWCRTRPAAKPTRSTWCLPPWWANSRPLFTASRASPVKTRRRRAGRCSTSSCGCSKRRIRSRRRTATFIGTGQTRPSGGPD